MPVTVLRFSLLLLLYFSINVTAQASYSPKYYQLECGEYFSCPQAMHRRIHFWIDIFGRYNTDTAVFHDREQPDKVYSVLERTGACGGRLTPKAVEKERTRLKHRLLSIANKKQHQKPLTKLEYPLALLFKNESPSSIREASKRIRCQSGNSTRFLQAIKRFGTHRHTIASALKEFGLPEGIQYLPFVESAYYSGNYSRVGAAGLWQLMPGTASHLGLIVNPVIDERVDPEISTLGAIKYLQHSFEILAPAARTIDPTVTEADIYPFVMTSYNFGLSGMLRAMNEVGVDFVEVLEKYQSKSFQVAVKNFYASFLAARHVATHADQFFPALPKSKPAKTVSATNNKARSAKTVARHFGLTVENLKQHNPALTSAVWKGQHLIPKGYVLHIPLSVKGNLKKKIARLNRLPADKPPRKLQHYRVKRGDTACGIAHRFKVSCKQLVRLNKLGKKAVVRLGRTLTIPGGSIVIKNPITAARARIFGNHTFSARAIMSASVNNPGNSPLKYTVAKGDTICGIARKYLLSCSKLVKYNQLGSYKKIYAGQSLAIPGRKTLAASQVTANIGQDKSKKSIEKNPLVFFSPGDDGEQLLAEIHSVSYLDRFLSSIKQDSQPEKEAGQPIILHHNAASTASVLTLASNLPLESALTQSTTSKVQTIPKTKAKKNSTDTITTTIKVAKTQKQATKKHLSTDISDSSRLRLQNETGVDLIELAHNSTKDLRVSYQKDKGWIIRVATDETLGHYADWLDIGFSKSILKLNRIKSSRSVRIGKIIQLPIKNKAAKQRFEEKRIAFHQNLQRKYLSRYSVTGKKQYRFQPGDNPWTIASAHQIPLWLLKRFNPDIFINQHDVGNVVVLPVLQRTQS